MMSEPARGDERTHGEGASPLPYTQGAYTSSPDPAPGSPMSPAKGDERPQTRGGVLRALAQDSIQPSGPTPPQGSMSEWDREYWREYDHRPEGGYGGLKALAQRCFWRETNKPGFQRCIYGITTFPPSFVAELREAGLYHRYKDKRRHWVRYGDWEYLVFGYGNLVRRWRG